MEDLLLWYDELCTSREGIGLRPVPGVLCLFSNDIIVLAHP
jgi:hypothetical protein